jgi:large subunit ribosomal protein L13
MKTYMAKQADIVDDPQAAGPGKIVRKWHLVDGTDKTVGRLATQVARILMGKHRPTYTPHVDTGDFVVIYNAEKVKFTGTKWKTKQYKRYTGYPGGLWHESAEHLRNRRPTEVLKHAVRLMLPKNKLSYKMLSKLKLYAGPYQGQHNAQNPQPLDLKA